MNRGTIRQYMWQARRKLPPQQHGQSWATFLATHSQDIWACDFVQTYNLFFRSIFLFFIVGHHSRRVVHCGVTRSPTDAWIAQQIREATAFGEGPRFLLCDNNAKYGSRFQHAVEGAHIEIIHTPRHSPKVNAICERFISSVRRECLDFMLNLNEAHARRIVREYLAFFNHARPHQGIDPHIPVSSDVLPLPSIARHEVVSLPVLRGLQHDYRWAA